MKTKKVFLLMGISALCFIYLMVRISFGKEVVHEKPSKPFLTVSEAKQKAFETSDTLFIHNLKGIFSGIQPSSHESLIFLEDEEPSGMEDVLLYCTFKREYVSLLKDLDPGTEITVSGVLSRKGNSAAVSNCRIICINKGTLQKVSYNLDY